MRCARRFLHRYQYGGAVLLLALVLAAATIPPVFAQTPRATADQAIKKARDAARRAQDAVKRADAAAKDARRAADGVRRTAAVINSNPNASGEARDKAPQLEADARLDWDRADRLARLTRGDASDATSAAAEASVAYAAFVQAASRARSYSDAARAAQSKGDQDAQDAANQRYGQAVVDMRAALDTLESLAVDAEFWARKAEGGAAKAEELAQKADLRWSQTNELEGAHPSAPKEAHEVGRSNDGNNNSNNGNTSSPR